MRYYSIAFSKTDGTAYTFKSLKGMALTSLLPQGPQTPQSGLTNPAALNIEMDIPVLNANAPINNAFLRIWGLGLEDIGSAANLNGLDITVSAGMAKGLPLANPQQAGVICKGSVYQAYGNWIGTAQTIDLAIVAGGSAVGSAENPQNFAFSWPAGTPLKTAIANALTTSMPGFTQSINISPNLVLNHTETGHYQSLGQLADAINGLSQSIIGDTNYDGVSIATNGNSVIVFDGTQPPATVKAIAVTDLIGQPTWIGPFAISVKTVMRADIAVGDTVSLPKTIFTQTQQSLLTQAQQNPSGNITFSGKFLVQQVEHFGNFRQADAESWNTTFQMTTASNATSS